MKINPEATAKLGVYLEASDVVEGHHLEAASTGETPVNIMMGQTFDDGQPLDMVKYSLLMAGVNDVLEQGDVEAQAKWLMADHFISEINQDQDQEVVRQQLEARTSYLARLNDIFGIDIGFVSSAELSQTPAYRQNLDKLTGEAESNPDFMQAVLLAVPEDRRDDPSSVQYPLEELATIESMGTDIKVGPVYERKYDVPSRNIAAKIGFNVFSSIYGTRGYLFGGPNLPPTLEQSIEEFGILPYKIDSKGQRESRIDPVNSEAGEIEELVSTTVDTRAIKDLLAVASMAKERLEGSPLEEIEVTEENIQEAKKIVFNAYLCYIYSPLS